MNKLTKAIIYTLLGAPAAVATAELLRAAYSSSDAIAAKDSTTQAATQYWTCGMHPFVKLDHPGLCPICHMPLTPMHQHAGGDASSGPPMVVIDPAVVQNMGIRTAEVTHGPLMKSIRVVGVLDAPEPGLHEINLKVSGWIVKLYANQDSLHVHKGDPLFQLYSPTLIEAGEELVSAVKSLKTIERSNDPDMIASAREHVAGARQKLSQLDVSDTEIDSVIQKQVVPSTFTFTSPATGAVIDKIVVEGSGVTAGMKLMRIEDHESLWLDLQVYESDVALVSVGQSVNAIVDAWPGRTIHGTISFIHPHLDYTSRTVMARATLDNTDQILHPGMYASATIMSTPVADAVLVPREAVIDTGTSQTAFVAHPGGHFEPRKVRMGILADDGRVQILEGLSPGEVVVTSGQFLLDVESRTTEAIDKLKEVSPAPANPSEARP